MPALTRPWSTAPPRLSAAPREISLLRASMRALGASRRGCADCHRNPLVGETVFFYGHALVCALCRPGRREAPARQERVHSPERGHTVKRATR